MQQKLTTLIFVLLVGLSAWAHDFGVDGIYYKITSSTDLTVSVTYRGSYSSSNPNEYTGAVVIPSTVGYNSKTYNVTSIGSSALEGCSGLTSVTIPSSVTSIGDDAFSGCSGLTSVTIPNSVTSIGNGAFYYCSSLTSVTIPSSVTSIGDYAFVGCEKLQYNEYDNALYLGNAENPCLCLVNAKNTSITSCTINENTKKIGSHAFFGCSGLTSVTIPSSVTSIGSQAFRDCCDLTSVTIPSSVTSIGFQAFVGCEKLQYNEYDNALYLGNAENPCLCLINAKNTSITSCTINGNTKLIYPDAFRDCSGLTSVTIGNSVTSIGDYAFRGCSGLTSVTIGNSVTSIGDFAFDGCSGLTSVTIGNSVTSIGSEAFSGCSGLESMVVDEYNKVYDSRDNCNAIIETETNTLIAGCKETTIPGSIASIGYEAFYGCIGLTAVTIPSSVTSIGYGAFHYCSGLESIIVDQDNKVYDSRDNCNAIIETETNTLIVGFKETTIPGSVASIGSSAFYGCSGLTSVTIPSSVTSIGTSAFYGCSGLTSVTIPSSVTWFGWGAFQYCSSLASMKFESETPCNISLYDYDWIKCPNIEAFYIPSGTTEAYKEAWGTYYYSDWGTTKDFNFVEYDSTPTTIDDITTSRPAREGIYNLQGQKLSAPQRGLNIINGKKVIIK